eukprot:TRINITY_DN68994_c0_g1_i1.p1 TRINITY_DN68994_c0_g1~~TRINITY_DN68994_c0_g1_i1.p1  ORF type:complete len:154 (+),score=7.68 TRINITY_DN68994_c0_g1_i1:76-537(+)
MHKNEVKHRIFPRSIATYEELTVPNWVKEKLATTGTKDIATHQGISDVLTTQRLMQCFVCGQYGHGDCSPMQPRAVRYCTNCTSPTLAKGLCWTCQKKKETLSCKTVQRVVKLPVPAPPPHAASPSHGTQSPPPKKKPKTAAQPLTATQVQPR